jgi:hypothetical protein
MDSNNIFKNLKKKNKFKKGPKNQKPLTVGKIQKKNITDPSKFVY